jgi:hypothetical protein
MRTHEDVPLDAERGGEQSEAHRRVHVLAEKSHQETEAEEDHDY